MPATSKEKVQFFFFSYPSNIFRTHTNAMAFVAHPSSEHSTDYFSFFMRFLTVCVLFFVRKQQKIDFVAFVPFTIIHFNVHIGWEREKKIKY